MPHALKKYHAFYRGADKSLSRPGRKQARKHIRDARDFNNIETRALIKFLFLQGKAPKEIHAILTETVACFLPGRAKDLSARVLITVFKDVHIMSISWAGLIQSTPSISIYLLFTLILCSHLRLCFPCGLFPSGFPFKTIYGHLSPTVPQAVPLSFSVI